MASYNAALRGRVSSFLSITDEALQLVPPNAPSTLSAQIHAAQPTFTYPPAHGLGVHLQVVGHLLDSQYVLPIQQIQNRH